MFIPVFLSGTGGMFDYISGANFFGEMIEWWGFALACYSLPAVAFAMFTALNIGPRAYSHHRSVRGQYIIKGTNGYIYGKN